VFDRWTSSQPYQSRNRVRGLAQSHGPPHQLFPDQSKKTVGGDAVQFQIELRIGRGVGQGVEEVFEPSPLQ
jgi:hypothetical protein